MCSHGYCVVPRIRGIELNTLGRIQSVRRAARRGLTTGIDVAEIGCHVIGNLQVEVVDEARVGIGSGRVVCPNQSNLQVVRRNPHAVLLGLAGLKPRRLVNDPQRAVVPSEIERIFKQRPAPPLDVIWDVAYACAIHLAGHLATAVDHNRLHQSSGGLEAVVRVRLACGVIAVHKILPNERNCARMHRTGHARAEHRPRVAVVGGNVEVVVRRDDVVARGANRRL